MISVIIPTYNEKNVEIEDLRSKAVHKEYEVIIVDSSENDDMMKKADAKVLKSKKGRAVQMNFGAKHAKGDVLLFLHADTILPDHWDELIMNSKFDYGCFYKKFDSSNLILKLNAFFNNIRLRLFSSMLGDNALFINNQVFREINGYKELQIMEDVDLSRRLKGRKIKIIKEAVVTSARRFRKGVIRTLMLMQLIRVMYLLRIKNSVIKKFYK